MAVLVGSARSSYGNTNPGDQNDGREVSTENTTSTRKAGSCCGR